VSITGLY